jgi:nucleotide-binding universal stress UspA family protein
MNALNTFNSTLDTSGEIRRTKLTYLLAYDRSQHARAAVELLLDLPSESGISPSNCAVTLMTVLPTQSISGHEDFQAALEREEQRLLDAGFEAHSILKAGNPAATLNDFAKETQADLILIGAKGLRAALGVLLGGVAQQVVEYSSCPVLVVRAPFRGLKHILLVVDGSHSSKMAVEYLVPQCPDGSRARCSFLPKSASLTVMHVLPPPIMNDMSARAWTLGPEALYPAPLPAIDKKTIEASEQTFGEKLLSEMVDLLGEAGLQPQPILVRGDAAEEILGIIRRDQIDLVVCGSRGLSAISSWLLGSVSRKLVHYSDCSVLIVK